MRTRVLAAALLVAAASNTSAWAGWGCAAYSREGILRRWDFASESEARKSAMDTCKLRFHECRLIGCSNNVNNKEDADRIWARTPGVKYEPCGGDKQRKC